MMGIALAEAPAACPKCGYVRKATDAAPAWECPACGIAVAKYVAAHSPQPAPPEAPAAPYEVVAGPPPVPLPREWNQRRAILAAGFAPLLISLQLFAALLFPSAFAGRSWAIDAPMLIGCELLMMHAGVMMSGVANADGFFRFVGMTILTIVYAGIVYGFARVGQSWWIAINLGALLIVRFVAALHDAQGAGERISRGFLTLMFFMVVLMFPIGMAKRFPAFGYSPEVFARLQPDLGAFRGMIDKGSDLAKAVLLAALLYLVAAAMDLIRLRMVYRDTSAPGVSVADGTLALRAEGRELTVASIPSYPMAFMTLTFGLVACAPTIVGLASGQFGDVLFGLLFIWFGYKLLRSGFHQLLSRTVFHARKGEIVMREDPFWGDERVRHLREHPAAALTVADGYNHKNAAKPEFYKVMLKIGGEDVELASGLGTRSQAEGLRKLLLAHVEGLERPEVRQTLRDDADMLNLAGGDVDTILGAG
jgi:hypothetical protein